MFALCFSREAETNFWADRLSSPELLNSCKKGLTQNQNESLNNVLWAKCWKRFFIGKDWFAIAVCQAITAFNDETRSTKTLFQKLNSPCGHNTAKALSLRNNIRFRNSRLKVSEKYKKQRQKLWLHHKNKGKGDSSYIPGAFSSHVTPDTLVLSVKKKKISESEISFIYDDSVEFYIWKLNLATF